MKVKTFSNNYRNGFEKDIQVFLDKNPSIEIITLKYAVSHSNYTESDNYSALLVYKENSNSFPALS